MTISKNRFVKTILIIAFSIVFETAASSNQLLSDAKSCIDEQKVFEWYSYSVYQFPLDEIEFCEKSEFSNLFLIKQRFSAYIQTRSASTQSRFSLSDNEFKTLEQSGCDGVASAYHIWAFEFENASEGRVMGDLDELAWLVYKSSDDCVDTSMTYYAHKVFDKLRNYVIGVPGDYDALENTTTYLLIRESLENGNLSVELFYILISLFINQEYDFDNKINSKNIENINQ